MRVRNRKRMLFMRIFFVNIVSKKYHPIYVRNGQILKFWPMTLEYLP